MTVHTFPRWASVQPSVPQASKGNPICDKLVYAGVPVGIQFIDGAQNQLSSITGGTPTVKGGWAGRAINFGGTQWYNVARRGSGVTTTYIQNSSSPHTMLAVFRTATIATGQCLVCLGEVTDANLTTSLFINGTVLAHGIDFDNGAGSRALSTLTIGSNTNYVAAVSVKAANSRTFMVNGVTATNATNIAGGTVQAGISIGAMYQNSAKEAGTEFSGDIFMIALWNRALTATELNSLGRNPWQIFDAPSRRHFAVSSGATAYTLAAAKGAFTLTGIAANLQHNDDLVANAGSFTETGKAANLLAGRVVAGAKGTFAETGNVAGLLVSRVLNAARGTFTESGISAGLQHGYTLNAGTGSFIEAGNDADLVYSGSGGPPAYVPKFTGFHVNLGSMMTRS